jgi:hypothetical protein
MIIDVGKEEFEGFKAWARSNRWGWPAKLSTNDWRDVWEPPRWGYTHFEERKKLHDRFLFVDRIVEAYLNQRPGGGRFFVDNDLAYYKPEERGNPRYGIAALRVRN